MDLAYISAFSALAGSAIGGLTSLAASWLSQHVQFRESQIARELSRREDLYRAFVEEASKWYAHAYENENARVSDLVNLWALVSRMRVLSSSAVVAAADRVVRRIIEQYRAPKKTLHDVVELLDHEALNPLFDFSNACRNELDRS